MSSATRIVRFTFLAWALGAVVAGSILIATGDAGSGAVVLAGGLSVLYLVWVLPRRALSRALDDSTAGSSAPRGHG